MAGEIKLKVKVDTTQVDAAQAKINKMGSAKAIQNGVAKFNGIAGNSGINLGGIGNFASKLGGITKILGPVGIGLTSIVGACKLFTSTMNNMIAKGQQAFDDYEQAVAKTRIQMRSYAPGASAESVVSDMQQQSENGVASLDELMSTFNNLLPVLDGNVEKGKELTVLLQDMQAAGKGTASDITNLIAKVKEQGEVTSKDVKRIENQGLPIYRELAKVRREEEEATRQAVKAGKVNADEFVDAIKAVAESYKGTAAELSATTEGAKASMKAAKGRAYMGFAAGAGAADKLYYQQEQSRYDAIAADEEAQRMMYQAAMAWQAVANRLERLATRTQEAGEGIIGWVARMLRLGDNEIGEQAAQAAKSAKKQEDKANAASVEYTTTDGDLLVYLQRQIVALREVEQTLTELRKMVREDDLETVENIERQAEAEKRMGGGTVLAAAAGRPQSLLQSDTYLNAKKRLDAYKETFDRYNDMIALIDNVLKSEGVTIKALGADSYVDALVQYYQQRLIAIKQEEAAREKAEKEAALASAVGGLSDLLFDAYGNYKVGQDKAVLMGGDLSSVRSGNHPIPDIIKQYMSADGNSINFARIGQLVGDEQDKVIDALTQWIDLEVFGSLTNLNTVFAQAGIEPYDYQHAQEFVDEFEKKISELYYEIQGKVGKERYVAAGRKLSELFGSNDKVTNEDELADAIKTQVSYYEAITKAMADNSKTAAEYIKSELDKVERLEAERKAKMRDAELKRIEEEQFTKSDPYNSLSNYKRKLESAKDYQGKQLYSDKEIARLVRMMGNKMLEEQRKSNTIKDNGRWVNAHRVQAADGYIGAKVAGYKIRDSKTEEQIKQAKEANKKLSEIKQAIKEVDKTPRAV